MKKINFIICLYGLVLTLASSACKTGSKKNRGSKITRAVLVPSEKFLFNSFVDCNMATVWVKDTFRIFPGKYGEDPLWGEAHELKFASGSTVDEVFSRKSSEFKEPIMPPNAPPGQARLTWCCVV
jgi:hypothetical protein